MMRRRVGFMAFIQLVESFGLGKNIIPTTIIIKVLTKLILKNLITTPPIEWLKLAPYSLPGKALSWMAYPEIEFLNR
jgi:hypothetical protein